MSDIKGATEHPRGMPSGGRAVGRWLRSISVAISLYGSIFTGAVKRFLGGDALMHAAALSFFTVFSLPPMLLVILWSAGLLYQEASVSAAIYGELSALIGADGTQQLMATLEELSIEQPTLWATATTAIALAVTASTVLVAGQNAINQQLQIDTSTSGAVALWRALRDRILSLAMLATFAFILSVCLVLSALIALLGISLEPWLGSMTTVMVAFDYALLDFAAMGVVFTLLFRYLPDKAMKWRDAGAAALLTALLFLVGQHLIRYLIGNSEAADYYDAAGGVLVLMLWVYCASAIVLFGAAFAAERAEVLGGDHAKLKSDQSSHRLQINSES